MSGLLTDYDFHEHVASDIGVDEQYLSPDTYSAQTNLNFLSNWTTKNIMKINEKNALYDILKK